jgi:hypothetical protein
VQTIVEKHFSQSCRNITFVAIHFAKKFSAKRLNNALIAVICIARSYTKIKQFTRIVYYQMQFESVKPAHCAFANGSNVLENLVSTYSFIITNRYFCGINEGNSGAFSATNQFEKKDKMNHNFSFKFYKTIVRQ